MIYTCETCATQEHTEDEDPITDRTSLVKSRERWCKTCKKTKFHFAARSHPVRAQHERILPNIAERTTRPADFQKLARFLTEPPPRRP